jgi:hypothetical protein
LDNGFVASACWSVAFVVILPAIVALLGIVATRAAKDLSVIEKYVEHSDGTPLCNGELKTAVIGELSRWHKKLAFGLTIFATLFVGADFVSYYSKQLQAFEGYAIGVDGVSGAELRVKALPDVGDDRYLQEQLVASLESQARPKWILADDRDEGHAAFSVGFPTANTIRHALFVVLTLLVEGVYVFITIGFLVCYHRYLRTVYGFTHYNVPYKASDGERRQFSINVNSLVFARETGLRPIEVQLLTFAVAVMLFQVHVLILRIETIASQRFVPASYYLDELWGKWNSVIERESPPFQTLAYLTSGSMSTGAADLWLFAIMSAAVPLVFFIVPTTHLRRRLERWKVEQWTEYAFMYRDCVREHRFEEAEKLKVQIQEIATVDAWPISRGIAVRIIYVMAMLALGAWSPALLIGLIVLGAALLVVQWLAKFAPVRARRDLNL